MRQNRRVSRPKMQVNVKTLVSVAAIVVALAMIPLLVSLQSGRSEAASQNTAVAVGADTAEAGAAQGGGDIGPLNDADRAFLVAVRRAGLWEIPAGRMAQTQASSEAVKRAGLHLLEGHTKLDQLVREDAQLLGVTLPNEATPEQQGWVSQMEAAKGAEFDRLFANLLRAAHGKIFTTVAQVRGATQNDIIRRHARQANQTVLDHIEVLDDTGLVETKTLEEVGDAVAPK